MINPVSPFFGLGILIVGSALSLPFAVRYGGPLKQGRYVSIDGLRGYLALCVFLHHSAIWYFYLRTGEWNPPPSNFYTHCGQSSVVLFFMITGFLFCSKLIQGRSEPINWSRLYVSRFFRIVPLYIFFLLVLFTVVAILSDFTLMEPLHSLIAHGMTYLPAGLLGTPDINKVNRTALIFSDVTWILKWEWCFYFSLPILAIFIRSKPPLFYVLTSVIIIVLGHYLLDFNLKSYIRYFSGGILAAFLARNDSFRSSVSGSTGAVIVLLCIVASVLVFKTTTNYALCLVIVAFSIIASGNTLFGLFSSRISRMLGEMSYSIYLFQGFILFIAFKFIVGFDRAKSMTPLQHWLVISLCACVLIPVSFLLTRFIEAPPMRTVSRVTAWIDVLRIRLSNKYFRLAIRQ